MPKNLLFSTFPLRDNAYFRDTKASRVDGVQTSFVLIVVDTGAIFSIFFFFEKENAPEKVH